MAKNRVVSFVAPAILHEALRHAAAEEDRSMGAFLRRLLRQHLPLVDSQSASAGDRLAEEHQRHVCP